jgi:folate-binding protein YgfZ
VTLTYALLDDLPGQVRALVRLQGPDTARFVQGTLTADVSGAPAGTAVAAAACTPKGKIITELVALPQGETCDLLVPEAEAAAISAELDRHIIMDQVEVSSPPAVAVAVVWAADGVEIPAPPGDLQHYATRHPGPGRLWLGPAETLRAALADGVAVDADGWARRRIETATPAWGHEIEANTFPAEVGFVYAVSYSKGCFTGQEPLARIHSRGQVNRVMVRVRSDRSLAAPTSLDAADRPETGRLTTAAPEGDGIVGLAIVRREHAVEGVVLTAGDIEVTVTSGPLGDDPGVTGNKRSAPVKLGGRR